MLYELGNFSSELNALNVFRYITFRAAGATATAMFFLFLFGPTLINLLRVRQGKGQPIRDDGPTTHHVKRGTPTLGGLVILLIPLLLSFDIVHIPWINKMDDTVVVGAQEGPRLAAPAKSVPVQGPVFIAGEPATAPLPATGVSLRRGQALFGTNCAMCHGMQGDKVGAEVGKYFPEVPQSLAARAAALSDQDLFRVIRLGKNRMPSLAENLNPGETWDIVNYVRSLGE